MKPFKKAFTAARLSREIGFSGVFRYLQFQGLLLLTGLLRKLIRFDLKGDPARKAMDDFFVEVNAMSGPRVLELGGANFPRKSAFPSCSEFVAFDINPGPHVDVVGDIHHLSEHLPANHFDVAYAIFVFEHLSMPWKAVQEINKVLKPGGTLYIFTHHTFPLHAEPWDFWRFSRHTFPVLLNRQTGFRITRTDLGWPCLVVPLEQADSLKQTHTLLSYMGISVSAVKTGECDGALRWDLDDKETVEGIYPLDSAPLRPSNPFLEYLESRRNAVVRPKP